VTDVTEAVWLACDDPVSMLTHLQSIDKANERKLRLFSVACCRRLIAKVPVRPRRQRAVEVAELYADGLASDSELSAVCLYANNTAEHACRGVAESEPGIIHADCTAGNAAWAMAEHLAVPPAHNGLSPIFNAKVRAEQSAQAVLLRDIFGNPFRPVTLDPAWLTSDVVALARGIYEERAFDRMPILADALQEAGCDSEEVGVVGLRLLRRLDPPYRRAATHVRGCWVLDLVRGKE
jgi:hypothetical protein